jgi:hypothetical protein
MHKFIQNLREGKEYDNAKIGPMGHRGIHHQKEKTKRPMKISPENEK